MKRNLNVKSTPVERRTVLRGLGVSLALPWLEAMGPMHAWASDDPSRSTAPNRAAFLYVPNGKNMADWTPKTEGADFELTPILEPLKDHKKQLLLLSGLTESQRPGSGITHACRRWRLEPSMVQWRATATQDTAVSTRPPCPGDPPHNHFPRK